MKSAALVSFAFDPDAPAHQFDKPLADGKAEPRASEFSRDRSVGLDKRLEDDLFFFGRDPYAGIFHLKTEGDYP